jgi:hypothetical protein
VLTSNFDYLEIIYETNLKFNFMKQVLRLQLKDAHVMSKLEMKQSKGGDDWAYCCSLIVIVKCNDLSEGAMYGFTYGMEICAKALGSGWGSKCAPFECDPA